MADRPDGSRRNGKRRVRFNGLHVALFVILFLLVAGFGTAAGFVVGALRTLPDLALRAPTPQQSSIIYDSAGNEIVRLYDVQNRSLVSIDELPKFVPNAFIAVEDRRFYSHRGVDVWRTLGALVNDLRGGSLQGGSTITQQLARNLYERVGTEQTVARKIREAVVAVALERRYTKAQILEMYLNQIYFGHSAYGIEAASQLYFGKRPSELTLDEAATLAALPKAPNYYEPKDHPDRAQERRNVVLSLMREQNMITDAQYNEALAAPITVAEKQPTNIGHADVKAPWFVDYVVSQLLEHYSPQQVYQGGLRIYTTLDLKVQDAIDAAVSNVLDERYPLPASFEEQHVEAGMIIMEPDTGYVRGIYGGRMHDRALAFDFATEAHRNPGSAIKPLVVYTPALMNGMTAATVIDDAPELFAQPGRAPFAPQNFEHNFSGLTTLREAVRRSVNVVAVKVLAQIGVETGYQVAKNMGIASLVPQDAAPDHYSLALGGLTQGTNALEMAIAYSTLANGGSRPDPIVITKVTDPDGKVLERHEPSLTRVVDTKVAYIMTDILRSVVEERPANGYNNPHHTGGNAKIPNWPTAGKTGTTDERADAWFAGYTPHYTGVVWLGYSGARRAMPSEQGGASPAKIFRQAMTGALDGIHPTEFQRPDGIVAVNISAKSGKIPSPQTPPRWVRPELFSQGTQPAAIDDAFYQAEVCQEASSYLYDATCSTCTPASAIFLRRPAVTVDDVRAFANAVHRSPESQIPADMSMVGPQLSCLDNPDLNQGPPPDQGPPTGGEVIAPGTFELSISNGQWSPFLFTAKAGQYVFAVTNADTETHRFTIKTLHIDVELPAGETVQIPVDLSSIDKPKLVTFQCGLHDGELGRFLVTP